MNDLFGAPLVVPETRNISELFSERARERPDQDAVRTVDGARVSFGELDRRASGLAGALAKRGLARGDRVCLFVRPGVELILIAHALLRLGAVPVLIDPGMGRRSLLAAVERMQPHALIGVPRAHVARLLFPAAFRSVRLAVTVGRSLGWGGPTLRALEREAPRSFATLAPEPGDEAAILFTSGSTGPPKGVVYTHGIFTAQTEALRQLYDLEPGAVDLACFPLFALFDHALGMTSVFAPLDPSSPATSDPAAIVAAADAHGATFSFGSPAIWRRVLAYLEAHDLRFRTLTRITIAGAPVPPSLTTALAARLAEGGAVHTPYGATEALPIASLASFETSLELRARIEGGEGTCVGRLAPGVRLRVIPITDEALEKLPPGLPQGSIGELVVAGPVVTPRYRADEAATRAAKAHDADGRSWHRMGDLGRIDEEGRVWFLGRKSHRLETHHGMLPPVGIENIFNVLEAVHRTALVGVGRRGAERCVLVVEAAPGVAARAAVEACWTLAATRTDLPEIVEVLAHPGFPVDVRHNAKIDRPELRLWAEARVL
ncbi:MAG: fatty acid CoA ligase family protein [Planctomycetota bacterium]